MSSKSSPIHRDSPAKTNLPSQSASGSTTCSWKKVVAIIIEVVSLALLFLGAAGIFGKVGSTGFYVSIAAGGAVFLMTAIILLNGWYAQRKQEDSNEAADSPGVKKPQNNVFTSDATTWGMFHNPIDKPIYYGPDAWKIWNLEILDNVPEPPHVDGSKVLLYIPERIRVGGQEKKFDLNILMEVSGKFGYFQDRELVKQQLGNSTGSGWIEIDKNMDPTTLHKSNEAQEEIVKAKGGRMPSLLEAIALNQLVFAHTGNPLWGHHIYTHCVDRINGSITYVGFGTDYGRRLNFSYGPFMAGRSACGAICVKKHSSMQS